MTTRVIIAEDSDIAAALIERELHGCSGVHIVGRARDGDEAIVLQSRHRAHVVLLDIFMPGRAGLGVVRELAQRCGVILVSDEEGDSAVVREALGQGASSFYQKRQLRQPGEGARLGQLIRRVGERYHSLPGSRVVAVVGSSGAMSAVKCVATALADTAAGLVLVQHLPPRGDERFGDWITTLGVPSRLAEDGDTVQRGHALVAPAGLHLTLTQGDAVALVKGDAQDGHCPSGSVMLTSAAVLGRRLIAVILSGMGRDGARAVPALVRAGATVLVQHPEDCPVPSMPETAIKASPQVRAIHLEVLGSTLKRLVEG